MNRLFCIFATLCCLGLSLNAQAFDPLTSIIGKGISTAMDVRSKDDVKEDVALDASITKKLLDQKGDAFKDVSVLVFDRSAVLVGFSPNEDAKRKAESLAREARPRTLKNDIIIGKASGSLASNAVTDEKISLGLTAAKGVSSVNMRWKAYGEDVFLIGIAQSSHEAELAIQTIRGIKGVKKVHASLTVRPSKKK